MISRHFSKRQPPETALCKFIKPRPHFSIDFLSWLLSGDTTSTLAHNLMNPSAGQTDLSVFSQRIICYRLLCKKSSGALSASQLCAVKCDCVRRLTGLTGIHYERMIPQPVDAAAKHGRLFRHPMCPDSFTQCFLTLSDTESSPCHLDSDGPFWTIKKKIQIKSNFDLGFQSRMSFFIFCKATRE